MVGAKLLLCRNGTPGPMGNRNSRTAVHKRICQPYKTIEALGEVMIQVE